MSAQTPASDKGLQIEIVAPLIAADEEHRQSMAEYKEAVAHLQKVVDGIAARQNSDAEKMASMLTELEAEERELRAKTQTAAKERIKRNNYLNSSDDFEAYYKQSIEVDSRRT